MFVDRRILPNVRNYITEENALPTIKKLFAGFQNGRIRSDLLQRLNRLKLYSAEGLFVPADELYLSDDYLPRLSLNNFHLSGLSFLSPIYLDEIKGDINRIKQFFLLLGVQEDIRLIQFTEDQHNELISAYRFRQTENLFRYTSLHFQHCLTLPFLEVTQTNYDFALYFWQHVINSLNVHQLNGKEILNCDQYQVRTVDNLPYWFVCERACIPTTTRELRKSDDVYSSDLRSITGDLLPTFACTTVTPFPSEWQQFFRFKTQLSIQDHIHLLNLIYDRSKNTPLNDESETCIQRIYSSLIHCLSRVDETQRQQHRGTLYLLNTVHSDFLPSNNLAVSLSRDLSLPNAIPQLKLSTDNARDPNLYHLLDLFNIQKIGMNDLALSPKLNPQLSLSLRAKLRDMQANLFELARTRNIVGHGIDQDFEVFEVDRLELYYNGNIPVLQLPIHGINNRIYVTHPWNTNEVMAKLPQMLCKQYKLPSSFEADIRQLLLNEQAQHTTTSLSLDPSIDLCSMSETRAKFASVIDRDNEKLFKHLEITDQTSPAEVLIKALQAQRSPFNGYVYHYTHLENAASILRDGTLKCRNLLIPNQFKDSAARRVIQTTRDEVKGYVRFYFRPLTPTQYCNENLGVPNSSSKYGNQPMCPVPVFFRIKLDAILALTNLSWKISLGNMASSPTEFDNTIDIVKRFDFQGVYSDVRTERGKYSSQQEFLIQSQLNFNQLKSTDIELIFQDDNARDSLDRLSGHPYSKSIDPSFYYGSNARILINSTNIPNERLVFIRDQSPTGVHVQLILQLSGHDTHRTIQGKLNKSIQRADTTTVYSNEEFSFIADLNTIEYSIYCECEEQVWLIHTNSAQARFNPPE